MSGLCVLLLSVLSSVTFAQELRSVTDCDTFLGYFRDHAVTVERIERTLENHSDVRPLYVSNDPDASLIILVSRHREARRQLVREIAGWLDLPTFVPGASLARVRIIPEPPRVRGCPNGLVNALALVENVGAIRSSYWTDDYLSVVDAAADQTEVCRRASVATLALMQSEFSFGEWANQPMRTLLENVRRESAGLKLDDEALRGLAGIYYVGRSLEMLED